VPVHPCLRFVNVLKCTFGLKNTRAYVTHRKNQSAATIVSSVDIYPFRDLYTTFAARGKGCICGFTSGGAFNDLCVPGCTSQATPGSGVSVLFQRDKEYFQHYAQAGWARLIAGPGHRLCAGIARCMCIRKCRCREPALSSDGTTWRPSGRALCAGLELAGKAPLRPVRSGLRERSHPVRDEPNHAGR
jgi:hypothetical protein